MSDCVWVGLPGVIPMNGNMCKLARERLSKPKALVEDYYQSGMAGFTNELSQTVSRAIYSFCVQLLFSETASNNPSLRRHNVKGSLAAMIDGL